MIPTLVVTCCILGVGLATVVLLQRSHNKKTTLKLANLQAELTTKSSLLQANLDAKTESIKTEVEQRLVDHTRYCEKVETMLKDLFAIEEKKWRELVERIKAQFYATLDEARKETSEKQVEIMAQAKKDLDKQMDNFRGLMEAAYLEQYEKMRRNPPRPTARPRRSKIAPPERYRSLDDDFNCGLPPEPEPKPEAELPEKEEKPKRKVRKRTR